MAGRFGAKIIASLHSAHTTTTSRTICSSQPVKTAAAQQQRLQQQQQQQYTGTPVAANVAGQNVFQDGGVLPLSLQKPVANKGPNRLASFSEKISLSEHEQKQAQLEAELPKVESLREYDVGFDAHQDLRNVNLQSTPTKLYPPPEVPQFSQELSDVDRAFADSEWDPTPAAKSITASGAEAAFDAESEVARPLPKTAPVVQDAPEPALVRHPRSETKNAPKWWSEVRAFKDDKIVIRMPEVNPQDAILAHVLKRKEEEKIESKDKDNKKHLDEAYVHSQTAAEQQLLSMKNQIDEERMRRMRHAAMTGRDWVEYLARKREGIPSKMVLKQQQQQQPVYDDNSKMEDDDGKDYNRELLESEEDGGGGGSVSHSAAEYATKPMNQDLSPNFNRTVTSDDDTGEMTAMTKRNPYDDFAAPPIEQVDTSPDPPPQSIPTSLKAHDRMRTHDYAPETYCEAENEGSELVPFGSGVEQFVSDNEKVGPGMGSSTSGGFGRTARAPSGTVLAAKTKKYSSAQHHLPSSATCHLARKRRQFEGPKQVAAYGTYASSSLFSSGSQKASFSSCCKKKKKKKKSKCFKKKEKKLKCIIEDKESEESRRPACKKEPCCPKQKIDKSENQTKIVCKKGANKKGKKKKSKCKKQKRDPCCKPPKKQKVKDESCGGACPELPPRKPPKKKKLKCKKLKHKCDDKPEKCCEVTKDFDCCQSHDKAKQLAKKDE